MVFVMILSGPQRYSAPIFSALAADYDETLACQGTLSDSVVRYFHELKKKGVRLILVTGRILDELIKICPHLNLFDVVVAENGAVLYQPDQDASVLLAKPFSISVLKKIRTLDLRPFSEGRVILATRKENIKKIQSAFSAPYPFSFIFNKNALMLLPAGVDKGFGLSTVLKRMGIDFYTVVGFGDAENDLSFLRLCGESVAVANAIKEVKEQVKWVTLQACGEGVVEWLNGWFSRTLEIEE